MVVESWRRSAACRGENPELFFPIGTGGPAARQIEQAKEICRRCPVVAQCLESALANGEDEGIWGATTPEERRMIRRSRSRRLAGLDAVRRTRVANASDDADDDGDECARAGVSDLTTDGLRRSAV